MARVNLFIALVLCFVSNCYSEVDVEEKDRLLNGFVDYLNNLPSQPYVYDDGVVLSAQKTDENSYKIEARLKATDIHNIDSVRYLKCTATIVDHQGNRYSVKNDEYFCENAESNGEVGVGRYEEVVTDPSTEEPPVQHRPVQLDNEVQPNNEAISGEQFVAIPREEPIQRTEARCIGCGSQVDIDAPGVSELAALGVTHLDMHESNVKHSLNRIVEVQRQVQVVNGVRYILTLLIDYNNCTEAETEACSFTQPCKVSILEKPWLKLPSGAKYRAVVANNCTDEWLFGDNGELVTEKPDENKVDDSDTTNTKAVDDILKVIHNIDLQSQQKTKILSEDDMKKIEEQIIPHSRFHDSPLTLDAVTETSTNDDISKQHNSQVESVNHYRDNLDTDTHSRDTASSISEDKKKAIDELIIFFDFAGLNSNRDRREYMRMKRSFDYDLQILSLAKKFKKVKDNITNAKYIYSVAQSMIDYLNEMDMENKRRMLKDVVAAEEESDNDHNHMYVQARVVIPCEKAKCENERTISNICNGVIDTTHRQMPQILTTFCYEEKKKMPNFGKVHVVPRTDPILQKLINRAIKKIESESVNNNAIKVVNIMDANTQKELGTLTKISAALAYTNCSKTTSFASRTNCTVLEYLGTKLCNIDIFERHAVKEMKITYICTERPLDESFTNKVHLNSIENMNNPKIMEMVQDALQYLEIQSNRNNKQKVVEVKSVTTQIIAGLLTTIDFVVGYTNCSNIFEINENKCDILENEKLRNCRVHIWHRPWLEYGKQINVTCNDEESLNDINIDQYGSKRSLDFVGDKQLQDTKKSHYLQLAEDNLNLRTKRQALLGGRGDKDPNDSRYKKLAEDSLQKYLQTSGTTQQHKVVKVDKVTVQVVSGTLTRLDFTVTRGAENSGDVINCHSKVWEQSWLNKTEIDVKCEIDNQNLRSKRQAGLPGGRVDKDPNDSRYKKLAEDSLQKYLQTSGTTQQHKVVKVDKVTAQVVSGTLTRLDFTVTRGVENSGDVIKCHSEVWEQSWLNKTEIDVKCEIDNQNLRSKRQAGLPGGRVDKDPNDSHYKKLAEDSLQKYLQTSGTTQQHKVVKVDKVTVQVVSGTLTRLDFTVTRGAENSGDVIKCHSEVWEQSWLNKTEIDVKCEIDNQNLRSKRQAGLPGGRVDKDPNDSHYKKLAEDSLQKYLQTSGTTQQHKVVKVDKVTVQVVSGTLTRLDFTVTRGAENSGDVIKCHSEVWEQSWLNKTEIDVKCEIDNQNLRSKRQAGLPGGQVDVDPNDSRYKKLAEDSLQKYLQTSGTTQQHKVVKVDKVTVQVVSGTLTRLDFTVTRGAENSGDVIKCHSEVWEQSWLNKTEIDVKCEIDNQNLRSKRQAGLPGGRVDKDPNDSHYKKLAEDSLQKYLQTSGTTQQHKVMKVDKVTVQVVSGTLTRLDFTVTRGVENSGDVIKCHSKVWEQSWLNKTEIDVKCEIDNQNLRSKRQAGLPGGRVDKDPNDSRYKKLAEDSLQKYLQTLGTTQQHKVVKVDKVTVQVVSGTLTRLDFTVTRGAENSGDVIKCHSEVWEQSWLNKTEIDVKCEIDNQNLRSKRQAGLPGGRVDKDPNDSHYKKLAEDSLQKYLQTSGTTQQHKVVKVDKVTVQVVSGTLTRLDFTVTGGAENSGDVIKCHSEVWEQSWLNKTEIDVKCEIDNQNLRSKRQAGLPGGQVDVDPNDSRYKKLAEDSLQKYLQTSGTTQQHKVVKVDKVTVQVVSGTLTRLDFTVTRGAENSGDVIKCHSEVWQQSWLNKTEIDVKCEIDNQNLRSKRQAGLPGGRVDKDPNDSHYKKLAEDSLQKYLQTSGTTQQHKVMKVDKVTVQVVSGTLTRLDFTVTRGVENSGDVIKCHSKVWEQSWLNKTEIDVKCEIDNQNLRSKRQAGLPGGRVDKDPNDSRYKKLAEDSLQKYLQTLGTTQQHKVVKVDKVTVQVVSGTLTRLDFTVTRGAENSGDVTKCHSEVWEQSWLNKTEIDVKCEIDNQNLRSKRQAGLPGGRVDKDPNDSSYKKLAEDSLQKYLQTSGTTQQHKVVKVDKVTVQVVSGTLTRLDFTVSRGAENSGDVIKCHSEVWEQSWLNKTEIDVKCEIDNQNLRTKRQAGLPGGRVDKDPNDSRYKKLAEDSLQKYLQTLGTTQQHKVVKVDKVTVQVVSGTLTRLDFTVTRGVENSGDVIKCHSEVWEQSWLNKTEIDVKCEIDNQNLRSKRQTGLPGGRVDKDPNDSRYKKLAEDSLQKYLQTSGTTQQHKVVKVDKVTVQVVSGTLTRLDFTVSRGAENSGDVIKCHSEVWEQSWLNKTEIDVKCEIDNQNLRSKRQAGLRGGRVDKDPNDSRYKKLAEDSLQKYLQTSGNTQQHKIVKVDKVTVQVVSGTLTRLDFTVTRGAENSGDVIKCHSEVWEQLWLNKTEIDVKCEIDNQNLRNKRQTGLPGGRVDKDPNDSRYKKLAEDSLQKYLQTSGTTQQHKVVKVDKVTVQVVSGTLTRLDFTVTRGAENSGDVIKCHSEVWEQPWLNKTEIDVKCEIDNQNLRNKRQARLKRKGSRSFGLKGGIVEQDPSKPEYKLLAQESLRSYQQLQGSHKKHVVLEVIKVTTQVVEGRIYHISYTATKTSCTRKNSACEQHNNLPVLYCHTKIWDRPWLRSKKIDVSCHANNDKISSSDITGNLFSDKGREKRSFRLGGTQEQDVNKEKYRIMVEKAIRHYEQSSSTKYHHELVKIHKVTEQVVAGIITKIVYTMAPTSCQLDESSSNCPIQKSKQLRCHAKIWGKPIAGTDIEVSCSQSNSLPKRNIDENNVEEDMKYYYAERAVQQMNDHSDTDNLYKLISVHSMHVSSHMYIPLVRMYIETGLTYCLRHQDDHDLANCEEMDGLNHKLCHARLYLSPEDEHVVQQVSIVCDDDPNFSSVTGLSIPVLLKASINEIERSPDVRYKMVHQGEPYVIPSLDSTKPIKMSFVVAYTNCSKDINIHDPKNVCFIDSLKSSMACNSEVYMVPNSREIERVIVSCKRPSLPRLKRSITLDNDNVTTDELEIQNLVNQAIEKLEMVSLHRYKQRLLKINSFSSKLTSGKVTTIDFDVGYTACLKYEWVENVVSCQVLDHLPRRHCVAQIYERLWLNNGKNIDVNCEDDETTPESHVEFESAELAMQLAKQALKHVEAKYPHPREQKVVRVFTLEKQVIAGLHYRLKMEVGFTNCTALSNKKDCVVVTDSGQNKFCRVNVWIRPWTNHAPNFRVSCDYQDNLNTELHRHVQAEHLFYDFLATYKPEYINDQAEMMRRFKIFEKNIEKIHFLNTHERGTATYAVTQFADLSYEEFTSKYLGLKPSLKNENDIPMSKAVIPNIAIPEKFDWRDHDAVTEVKNQGSCGSCWAFSVIGNIEGQWKRKSGELVSLSEQELVDCDKLDQGCNGGLPDNAYRAIEQLGGLELEKDYPYEGEDDKCSFNKSMARVQISGAVNITSNETDMAKWLVQNGPISIGINANAMQFYVGGVSHPWKMLCNPNNLDHGVLIVGYGVKDYPLFNKHLPYWTIKNSWGKFWGEQGYYRVYRGDGTCGLNQMASSAVI